MTKEKPFIESNIAKSPYFWVLIGFGIAAFFAVWFIPEAYYDNFYETHSAQLEQVTAKTTASSSTISADEPPDKEEIINKKLVSIKSIRESVIQVCAGFLAIIGLILTIKRTRALVDQNRINDEQNKINEVSNYNTLLLEQFSKASELLQSKDIAGRLSGIYLFEKIMNESAEYHWQVIELLTAYVRENRSLDEFLKKDTSQLSNEEIICFYEIVNIYIGNNISKSERIKKTIPKCPVEKDIQAILSVLGKRETKFESVFINNNLENDSIVKYINLSNTYLFKANLTEGNFEWFDFSNSIINETICKKAKLNYSNFYNTRLQNAHFENSSFKHANCLGMHIENSHLEYADFENADCIGAHFEFANCHKVNFKNANCNSTRFNNAFCGEADFENASCILAQFRFANCRIVRFNNSQCFQANFKSANCYLTNFENTECNESYFEDTDLSMTNFISAKNLTVERLIKAKSLYKATNLSPEIEEELKKQKPEMFEYFNSDVEFQKNYIFNGIGYENHVRETSSYEL
jgi:uncharacterized protein YjbI with pentapeptide repeats